MATANLPIHTVVHAALDYANSVLVPPPEGLAVEEIERTDDGRYWLVTVGYWRPKPRSPLDKKMDELTGVGLVLKIPSTEMQRVYKVVKVDSDSGGAVSMKNREP